MKVFITGVSGYVARVTLPCLFEDGDITEVRGMDVRAPKLEHPKLTFIKGDVRTGDIENSIRGADVAVHMAFIVGEIKDKKAIYDINVNGTKRTLEAVSKTGVKRLVVASSICAYGSHPNRGVITEETRLAGNPDSYYSHTKHIVEKMLDEFEKENPEVTVTRLRPSVLCGAGTDNFFLDLIALSVIPYPGSNPEGLPLVHEDDVGRAFHLAIKSGAPGAFNIAAGNLAYKKMGGILGKKVVALPYFILKPFSDIGFSLGFAPMSSHWMSLSRFPFHVSCEKAKKELGWAPRRTPEEAFCEMVAACGKSRR